MNCNAAVVSSLLLPSVRPSFLHCPSTKKNDVSSSSCNNDAISYKNIVAAATGLEKERKWEAGSENLRQLDDTHTRTSERKREGKKKKPTETTKRIPSLSSLPSPNAARLLGKMNEGTIAYNPDAQDSIRHSKGKTQRTTKNQKPTPTPKKKTRQLLSRRESNQACSKNPISSSTNKNKRGKKKMQFMKWRRTRRGSREAREEQEEELLKC